MQQISRNCTNPEPAYGGNYCLLENGNFQLGMYYTKLLKLFFKFILFLDNVTTKDFGPKSNTMQYFSSSAAQFFEFHTDVVIHTIPQNQKNYWIFELNVYPYLERLFGIQVMNDNKIRINCYDNLICLDDLDVHVDHIYQFVIRKYPDEYDDGLIKFDLLLNGEVVHSKKINQTNKEPTLTMIFKKHFFRNAGHLENLQLLSFNKTETMNVKCDPGILTYILFRLPPKHFLIFAYI